MRGDFLGRRYRTIVRSSKTRRPEQTISLSPFDDPTYGQVDLVANPIRLGRTPEILRMGAPAFGQHTDEVLREYGYIPEDIARFTEQGVIA